MPARPLAPPTSASSRALLHATRHAIPVPAAHPASPACSGIRRRHASPRSALAFALGGALLLTGAPAGAQRPIADGMRATAPGVAPSASERPDDAAPAATSLLLGGFLVGDSRLALLKGEHARGHWALVADVTRDALDERWTASGSRVASRGDYVLWAASAAVRRYTRTGGRGLFLEAGAGAARATLDVTPDGGAAVTRRATVPLANWGAGGRIGVGRSPAFVELGLRGIVPLATRHLHAGATPPTGSTDETVSYQSWYFGRGKPTSQLYVGLGLTR